MKVIAPTRSSSSRTISEFQRSKGRQFQQVQKVQQQREVQRQQQARAKADYEKRLQEYKTQKAKYDKEMKAQREARSALDRKLRGEASLISYDSPRAQEIYKKMIQDPQIQKGIKQAQRLKVKAFDAGFDSVEEYSNVSRSFQRQWQREGITAPKPPNQTEPQQMFVDERGQGVSVAPEVAEKSLQRQRLIETLESPSQKLKNMTQPKSFAKPTRKKSFGKKAYDFFFKPQKSTMSIYNPLAYFVEPLPTTKKAFKTAGTALKDFSTKTSKVGRALSSSSSQIVSKTGDFTGKRTGKALQTSGELLGSASLAVPDTVAGTATTIGTAVLFPAISPAGRTAVSGIAGGLGVYTSIKGKTPEERLLGTFTAIGGASGVVREVSPFVKGQLTKLSPRYRPLKLTPTEERIISNIPAQKGQRNLDLGIIPEGKIKSNAQSPFSKTALQRGAYGFSKKEQLSLIGKKTDATTASVGLFGKAGETVKIQPKESFGGVDFGLFFTPSDPKTGVLQGRISRLGLSDFFKTDFKSILKPTPIKFGGAGDPQFVVLEKTKITKRGGGGTLRALGYPSSELEVTTGLGEITSTKILGTSTIKGQRVKIISASLSKGASTPLSTQTLQTRSFLASSSKGAGRLSLGGFLSGSLSAGTSVEGLSKSINQTVINRSLFPRQSKRKSERKNLQSPIRLDIRNTFPLSRSKRKGSSIINLQRLNIGSPQRITRIERPLKTSIRIKRENLTPYSSTILSNTFRKRKKDNGKGKRKSKKTKKKSRQPQALTPSITGGLFGGKKAKPLLGKFKLGTLPTIRGL
jgi:hypothetical protein